MRLAAALCATALLSSGLNAEDTGARVTPSDRTILWQNVAYGMTVAEVRALYPDAERRKKETIIRDYQVTPECEAVIDIRHERGTVETVRVRGGAALGGRCADKVQAALGSRYGQPSTQAREGGSLFRRESTLITWNRDGVTLRFKRFFDGGIAQRSWELEYSTYQTEIAL